MRFYFSAAALGGFVIAIWCCQPSLASFSDWRYVALFIVAILLAPILFILLSSLFAPVVFGPLFRLAAKLNEAPFSIGDHVRILAGPHSGRVARVYEIWKERGDVRVELGAQAKEDVTDVFSFDEVCRESAG